MNIKIITGSLIALALILTVLFWNSGSGQLSLKPLEASATVYMSEYCGCCEVYATYLSRQGVDIEIVTLSDQELLTFKQELNIPADLFSCHTSIFGDYFVEGHIPGAAIEKLLEAQPDISGIALPGMPSGTPGMAGPKIGSWDIKGVNSDGVISDFLSL